MLYLDDSMSGSGRSEYVFSKSAVQKYSKLFVRSIITLLITYCYVRLIEWINA